MLKKTTVLFSLLALILSLFPISALAVTLQYFGTTSETNFLWADSTYGDDYFTSVSYVSDGSNVIEWYRMENNSAVLISSSTVSGAGTITPPSNTASLKLRSTTGGEIYLTYAETTNPNNREIYFEAGGNNGGDSGGVPGNSGDCGCIFRTPGWQEYMGKIDEIIGSIPPPPDWDIVAGTFRDTILPALRSDLETLIGTPKQQPTPPAREKPTGNAPEQPTGQLPEGFEDSGFSADDIKNSAPTIEERPDTSGGFEILDPVNSLPTQEEFKDNIPNEPEENLAPEVPDVPEDNTAPTPPEQENPLPSDPEENNDTAPTPTEPENTAPMPDDSGGDAPTPAPDDSTAPMPSDDLEGYPMPGADNSTAPIPGADTATAPTP